jgi:hypothetical protein
VPPRDPEQATQLARVRSRLADAVLAFCRQHETFQLADLHAFIRAHGDEGAPDSPSRILRDLRARNRIDYTVVNRRASQYRVTWIRGDNGRLFA